MRILFVDDEFSRFLTFCHENPTHEILWAQTCDAARQIVEHFHKADYFQLIDVIMLDHDLGIRPNVDEDFPEELTIREFVNFLAENGGTELEFTTIITHSSNPAGRDWICSRLTNCKNLPLCFTKKIEDIQ